MHKSEQNVNLGKNWLTNQFLGVSLQGNIFKKQFNKLLQAVKQAKALKGKTV